MNPSNHSRRHPHLPAMPVDSPYNKRYVDSTGRHRDQDPPFRRRDTRQIHDILPFVHHEQRRDRESTSHRTPQPVAGPPLGNFGLGNAANNHPFGYMPFPPFIPLPWPSLGYGPHFDPQSTRFPGASPLRYDQEPPSPSDQRRIPIPPSQSNSPRRRSPPVPAQPTSKTSKTRTRYPGAPEFPQSIHIDLGDEEDDELSSSSEQVTPVIDPREVAQAQSPSSFGGRGPTSQRSQDKKVRSIVLHIPSHFHTPSFPPTFLPLTDLIDWVLVHQRESRAIPRHRVSAPKGRSKRPKLSKAFLHTLNATAQEVHILQRWLPGAEEIYERLALYNHPATGLLLARKPREKRMLYLTVSAS